MIGNDIQKQIEVHNMCKKMYETEKEYLLKKLFRGPSGYKPIDYSGMPHGNSDNTSLDRQIDDIQKLQHMIELEEWAIEALERQAKEMKEKIRELKGIDAQVKYMRDFEGRTLQDIADDLGYSIDRIKQISARNPRGA
jgi:DNA-directed RNA polymerase specialized sigma subunit